MNVSDLGGVFKFFSKPEELPENLKVIYDAFIADPDADLKLDRDSEYYGPIIADYHRKNSDKQNKHILNNYTGDVLRADDFKHFESIKFLHNRYPDKMIHTYMDYIDINLDKADYDANDVDINITKIKAMLKCNVFKHHIFNLALFQSRFSDAEFLIRDYPNHWKTYKSKIREQLYYYFQFAISNSRKRSIKSYISILQFLKDHGYDITTQINEGIDYATGHNVELSKFFFENMTDEFRIYYAFWAIMYSNDDVFELIKTQNYYKDMEPRKMQILYDGRERCTSMRH
jgi:hypothetical protein